MEGESERERQLNFGDVVVEISAQNASCLGGEQREKKSRSNCGNEVAEIVGERK